MPDHRHAPLDPLLRTRTARRPGGGIAVLAEGELDLATGPQLERAAARARRAGRPVTLDLDGVVFIDCAGLRSVHRALAASEGRVTRTSAALDRLTGLLAARTDAVSRARPAGRRIAA
jgi:anti-anti-sigma factor